MKTFGLLNEVWWSPYANTVTLDCRVSYMIKVTEDCSTNIVGTLTDAEVVQLDGWSMPGYPENVPNDGTEYYFGIQEDYNIYDHGKNLNGSKVFWPYGGSEATAEPGDGFKVHYTGDKKGRFPYDPQVLYFDLNGKHISYADAKGMTICVYPLDQEIKMIHQDRFTK